MNEYEVIVETITPCGGTEKAARELIEVEAESPRAYVEKNGTFPIIDEGKTASGDTLITTGDGKGYFIRYTFC